MPENTYINMVECITNDNEFEKFLNSERQLYAKDNVDIILFTRYVSLLKTNSFVINDIENSVDFLYSFRDKFKTKKNFIPYYVIYNAIMNVSNLGYVQNLGDKDNLIEMLFINEAMLKKMQEKIQIV